MIDVNWDELLDEESKWGMEQKLALFPERSDDEFRMRVRIIGPDGQRVSTPIVWASEQEKSHSMHALSQCCRLVNARAVTVVSDSRYLKINEFCEHFGIAVPTTLDSLEQFEQFYRDRARIMALFDFYMGRLPRHTWEEALLVVVYGPEVKRVRHIKYFPVDGKLAFEVDDVLDAKVTINMIKPWWN